MTLISAHNSDGCIGRCDAKCHDATTPAHECDCICGGRNHGVGLKKAKENTNELAEELMNQYKKKHPDAKFELNSEFRQLELF